jgi:hypothetical protein
MDITKVKDRALVPLGGALVKGSEMRYSIDLVASKKYHSRPYKTFKTDQVLVDEKNGILRFTARPHEVTQFIWELVLMHDGKGSPVGLYTDVFVQAFRKTKRFAEAHLTGDIITCSNVGSVIGYVIEVQANSEIKVVYYD